MKGNGGLLLVLGHLLKGSNAWRDAKLTVNMMTDNEKYAEDAKRNVSAIISRLRIEAQLKIIVSKGPSFEEVLHNSLKDAGMVSDWLFPTRIL